MKLAIKRLTRSDLTFFRYQYENFGASNQKAINLNRDVFYDQLYPAIDVASGTSTEIGVALSILGPGPSNELLLRRKIIKGESYKNWRLNGELVENPLDEQGRFDVLKPDDLVVLGFEGELRPEVIRSVFVAQAVGADGPLLHSLTDLLGDGRRSMVAIDQSTLQKIVRDAHIDQMHPIHALLLLDEELPDAVQGYEPSIERLSRRRSARITKEAVSRARSNAERIGTLGEEFVSVHLSNEQAALRITSFTWISQEFALAPYDFVIDEETATEKILDVKATVAQFGNPFHISMSEIRKAASSDNYHIYRIYELTENSAKLRISEPFRRHAEAIIDAIKGLPDYATVDSFAILPTDLVFADELIIEPPE